MKERFQFEEIFPVSPKELYESWLNSESHSAMTGSKAECSDENRGEFTAWDGYIRGANKSLKPYKEIIQSWRTSDFKDKDPDSELIVRFYDVVGGCRMVLIHRNVPEGEIHYKQGWIDHYLQPMRAHFNKK
ncbi:MAG: hypothetical protein HKN61_09225 [Flavobacteriaceae bacterium]|nr:hypothetical protein [Flavobacteriaceae bacterium]